VEHVIPQLSLLDNPSHASTMLQTFYSLLTFAFKTQIFEKRIPILLKSGIHHQSKSLIHVAATNQSTTESDNLMKIINQLQPESSSRHEP
jgi:hypothetical protein